MENPSIFVLSGGSGASGEQLVHTALAQFPGNRVNVRVFSNVREEEQVDQVIRAAAADGALVLHTLVDPKIYKYFIDHAKHSHIRELDAMHTLLQKLIEVLNAQPLGHPGLYRKLHKAYFDRVAAIEYTMAHDDGKNPDGWKDAEIVIAGVSRVGKTPLSMYLSVLGWKVANVPLITDIAPHPLLFAMDRRRLIGLTIHPGQLIIHRQHRQKYMGAALADYVNPQMVHEEIEHFNNLLRSKAVAMVDVTDKPIESTADEVLRHIQH